jgi:Zn finger protein HypA/HybF involved in hydrogenase expression
LVKVNNYRLAETVYFATRHKKEEILSPLFLEVGLKCQSVPVDTDLFGTFSGEVERTGSVRETLRKKIRAAHSLVPHGRLFLASEGSFGPDPILGFTQSDLESLLLWDKDLQIEIYAEFLCRSPIHAETVFEISDDVDDFLKRISFPEHAVIVRPEGKFKPIFKGLKNKDDLKKAMNTCFENSVNSKIILATDLRADQNKTRRNAILKVGEALIEKLQSFCPHCKAPGFAISQGVPGLKCEECGEPSVAAVAVIFECPKCFYSEQRPRPDGRTSIPASECEHCNP